MLSNHIRFGFPLLVFPGISITINILPTYEFFFSSLLFSIHAHTSQPTFLEISPIFVVSLILSILILSSLVTPLINIFISTTSNFFSCVFFTAHVSAPYIIAGHTTVLYTFPLTLKLMLRSHRIPDTQCSHHYCIRFISAPKSPVSVNVAHKYLNVFNLSQFPACRLISEFPSKFPSPF